MQDAREALPWISLLSIPPGICVPAPVPPAPAGETPDPEAGPQTAPPEPCDVPPLFALSDLHDPTGLVNSLVQPSTPRLQFLYAQLSSATKQKLATTPLPSDAGAALVNDLKGLVIAVEAVVLLLLGAANIVSGQLLGAVILFGLALLAGGSAWALWPARRRIIGFAGARPRRAGRSRRPRH